MQVDDPTLWSQAVNQASRAIVHTAPATADAVKKVATRAHQIYKANGGTYTSALKQAASEHLSEKVGEWVDKGIETAGQKATQAARAAGKYAVNTGLPAAGRAAREGARIAGRATRDFFKAGEVGAEAGVDVAEVVV